MNLFTRTFTTSILRACLVALALHPLQAPAGDAPSADDVLKRLRKGNQRFVSEESEHRGIDESRRQETSNNGQHPVATVLTCSDSRVPPEILFDQGIGDLFVIRVAGNVCDVDEMGSIEYAVEHLHTPLVVVLGHRGCGAVTAVVDGAELHGNLHALVDNIFPAVARTRKNYPDLKGEALIEKAINANVTQSIKDLLKGSAIVHGHVKNGMVKIAAALYDLKSGKVEWVNIYAQTAQASNGQGTRKEKLKK